jgi:deferrochelatase/peroxidase EfeB
MFFGAHQNGVLLAPQDFASLVAFTVTTRDRASLQTLFESWTDTSTRLTQGLSLDDSLNYDSAPRDSGEIEPGHPYSLTITFAAGSSLFVDASGADRFNLAVARPHQLVPIDKLPADEIDASQSEGDLLIQVCANNQQVVLHAVRNLIRDAVGIAEVKWMQSGFSGRTSKAHDVTPRNLFGFKDGTANPNANDEKIADDWIWANSSEPTWFRGGTYLAYRKVRLHLEIWDRTSVREQEQTFGRTRLEGAPLSGGVEHSQVDFAALDSLGNPLIPVDSHVRIAHSSNFNNVGMLRRPFNYNNGIDSLGHQDAGLLFLAFTRSPAEQFIPVIKALAKSDALNEYQQHVASGMYAVCPGIEVGQIIFEGLL